MFVFMIYFVNGNLGIGGTLCNPAPLQCPGGYHQIPDGSVKISPNNYVELEDSCGYKHICQETTKGSKCNIILCPDNSLPNYDDKGGCFCGFILVQTEPAFSEGTITITSTEPKEPQKSQAERDCYRKGCFLKEICYPFGNIHNKTYCFENGEMIAAHIYRPGFVNQSEEGVSCSNNYECKTGFCSNSICINLTKLENEINFLREQVNNISLENQDVINEVEYNKTSIVQDIPRIELNLIQRVVNFLRLFFR